MSQVEQGEAATHLNGRSPWSSVMLSAVALLLTSVWPFAHVVATNIDQAFNWRPAVLYSLALILAVLLVAGLMRLLFRVRFQLVVQLCLIFIVMFFSFDAFVLFAQNTMHVDLKRTPLLIIWLVIFLVLCFAAVSFSRSVRAPTLYFLIAIAISAVPLMTIASSVLKSGNGATTLGTNTLPADMAQFNDVVPEKKRNVYYFLVDAYARQDVLSDLMSFDNEAFLSYLRANGFAVQGGAASNYQATSNSLSATFNMEYVPDDPHALKGHNPTVSWFKKAGYSYIVAPPGVWEKTGCDGQEDFCIQTSRPKEFERTVAALTPLPTVMKKVFGKRNFLLTTESYLEPEDLIERFGSMPEPRLFFGHFGGVHDVIYRQDCKTSIPIASEMRTSKITRRYVWSVDCTNRQLMKMLDAISANDEDAIVILQADHGARYGMYKPVTKEEVFESRKVRNKTEFKIGFGILSAIRLPESCGGPIPDDLTPVNNFRMVIACLAGGVPTLLPNKHFASSGDKGEFKPLDKDGLPD